MTTVFRADGSAVPLDSLFQSEHTLLVFLRHLA
jgi:hypothetical protein